MCLCGDKRQAEAVAEHPICADIHDTAEAGTSGVRCLVHWAVGAVHDTAELSCVCSACCVGSTLPSTGCHRTVGICLSNRSVQVKRASVGADLTKSK